MAKTATTAPSSNGSTPAPAATPAPKATRRTTAAVTPAAPTSGSSRTQPPPAVTPTPTIRTMIVLLPDAVPHESLTAHALDQHFGVRGALEPRFWAAPTLKLWQRGQLVGLRKGRPAACAGGPARLLDLAGLRQSAGIGAGIRHQVWTHAVRGTRPAYPWTTYLAKHLADPAKYSWDDAKNDFHTQPRVNAMRMHNVVNPGAGHLDLFDIEMFQAGQMAYQHHSAATAVCADALLCDNGVRLAPRSDALTDRTTYVEQALRVLDVMPAEQRLIAVSL
ncbi:hypothetical protein [Krasilnikovia sp. MM14-A1259]|uniref:hypothetical protein n=1 Tax=Krasilnikovia sp. MM14-A1259 TaxID=3373539 RepID=UPI00381C5A74